MKLVQLGASDLRVSRLTVGCWSFGGDGQSYWGEQSQQAVDALVREAIERGVNFFDTAFGYNGGNSEISLGKALKGIRDVAVICNKTPIQPMDKLAEYEQIIQSSLKRLDTDYIDLLMIHWPTDDEPLLRANLEALLRVQKRGMIRAIGVSNFAVRTMEIAREVGVQVVANEFAYNLMARGMEREILPYCVEQGIGVLPYMPLMQGILTGKYKDIPSIPIMRRRTIHFSGEGNPQVRHGGPGFEPQVQQLLDGLYEIAQQSGETPGDLAIAWLMAQPGVASVIAGCRDVAQLRENAEAVELALSSDVIAALNAVSDPLKAAMGGNLDMWQLGENTRIW